MICRDEKITYRELNIKANRLARGQTKRGVIPGDLIVVALDCSLDLMAALLAVLKTGATYVPIDPSYPENRINQVMEDATPKLIIVNSSFRNNSNLWRGSVSVETIPIEAIISDDNSKLYTEVAGEDLAYIIYTSGSTGRPKGVEISHGAVSNLLLSMRREAGCDEKQNVMRETDCWQLQPFPSTWLF